MSTYFLVLVILAIASNCRSFRIDPHKDVYRQPLACICHSHLFSTGYADVSRSLRGDSERDHKVVFLVCSFAQFSCMLYLFYSLCSQAPGNRNKALVFDVMGEGNLPCVTVLRPVQRTNRGHPMLQFKRLLVGRSQSLPIVIRNNGTLPAQVRSESIVSSLTLIFIGVICDALMFAG